jgi:hypothetical protein
MSRLDSLRVRTRPLRRYVASWLLAPLTIRRWLLLLMVAVGWVLSALVGCSTVAPLATREDLAREAQRLTAAHGDRDNWPAAERARWEAAAEAIREGGR